MFLSIFIEKSKTDIYWERSLPYKTRHGSMSHWISKSIFTKKESNIRDIARNIFLGVLSPQNHIQN